jgi:hypothetical protein
MKQELLNALVATFHHQWGNVQSVCGTALQATPVSDEY